MLIDITKQILHLQEMAQAINFKTVIFTFNYLEVNYKCLYIVGKEEFIIGVEGYNIAINLPIVNCKIDNYLVEQTYIKLKVIHKEKLKTKVFCDTMLNKILELKAENLIDITKPLYRQTKRLKDDDNDNRIYFFCWSRHHTGRSPKEENLEKTRKFFGEEIYLICKENKISSRWKSTPKF